METNGTKRDLQNNSEVDDLIRFVAIAVVGNNPSVRQKKIMRQIERAILSLYSNERRDWLMRDQSLNSLVRNARDRHLRTKYNITLDEWEQMFLNQSSACAICKCTNPGRQWHTDHCHATGQVRGILCHGCNAGIGYFYDSATALQSAIEYLAASQQK